MQHSPSREPSLSPGPTFASNKQLHPDFTPPPSLPTSPPASPQVGTGSLSRDAAEDDEAFQAGPAGQVKSAAGGQAPSLTGILLGGGTSSSKGRRDSSQDRSKLSHRRKERANKPAPGVAFPSSSSGLGDLMDGVDDEAPVSRGATPTIGRSEGRRIVSQTTTTTVRKTEMRHVRYSLPEFDDLFDENHPPAPKSRSSRHRNSSSSPYRTSTSTTSSPSFPRSHSPSGGGSGKSRRAARSTLQPRRSNSMRDSSPSSRGGVGSSWNSWRSQSSSSTSTSYRPSGPSSSSPFFSRSFGGGHGLALQQQQQIGDEDDPYSGHGHRSRSSSSSSLASHNPSASNLTDPFAFANAVSESTMPFVQPFVSAFAFLAVSAVAALTISAVLVASFSLTFYDDVGRRVGEMGRSFGGVREGVGRLIGSATRGAMEVVVRATATGEEGKEEKARETRDGKRREMPTVDEEDDDDLLDSPSSTKRGKRSSRSRTPSYASSSGTSSGTSSPRSSFPSFSSPLRPFTSFTSPPPATHPNPPASTTDGWNTDDDALPYDVPNPTPHHSRSSSPGPGRAPRSRTSTGSSSTASSALPPRPPLAVLIPSIMFALLFTIAKVLAGALKGKQQNGGRGGRSA
ncbi:hypothetical protein JCM8547_003969 [Rhodosporidiobolus lusitaniae]